MRKTIIIGLLVTAITVTQVAPVSFADINVKEEEKIITLYDYKTLTQDEIKAIDLDVTKADVVNIPDPILKSELNKILNQDEDSDITKAQLEKLTGKLTLSYKGIKNIEGVQYCTNVDQLNLFDNDVQDLSVLEEMPQLRSLALSQNNLNDDDIKVLAKLTNMEFLYLCDNNITDVSILSNMKKLAYLHIEGNNISDISKLPNSPYLYYLDISKNKISDISTLSKYKNLKELFIYKNKIADISVLKNFPNLETLEALQQEIDLPEIKGQGTVSLVNPIKGPNGEGIAVSSISNSGTYNSATNVIQWKNITKDTTTSFSFNTTVKMGTASSEFSGKATQKIALGQSANSAPTIVGASDVTINKGASFNVLTNVTASDVEDGNLTSKIKVTGTVNVNVAGKYVLTYTVTDSNGATTTVKRTVTVKANEVVAGDVLYQTHVQTYGWQSWKADGQMSGTSGEAKRLEGIRIQLDNNIPGASIVYRTHVQTYGWQSWKKDGQMSGTSGEAKRLEGIEIKLLNAPGYSVQYRVHVQKDGWQGWKADGQMAGTSGQAKRLEAIEIKIVKNNDITVDYRTHVQSYGWQNWVSDSQLAGTTGQAKRLEAIELKLEGAPAGANIVYQTHVQSYGWQAWKKNGQLSGTSGEAKRLEAIKIKLENAPGYKVEYRVHVQGYGWQPWKSDGQIAGTIGEAKRLEGIQVRVVKK